MLLLEERCGIEVVDTFTLQAALDAEPARLGLAQEAAPHRATLRASQTLGVEMFQQPLLTLLIIQ